MNKILDDLNLPGNNKMLIVFQRNQSEEEFELQMELDINIPADKNKSLEE